MTTRFMRTLAFALLAAPLALAQGTQTWTQTRFDDFERGTTRGVAIRSDGTLELAPAFKAITTTPSTYIWDLASDAQGNMYAATGSPARIYRITPSGQATIIFQPQELQVQSIVVDPSGALYAATSPDGKVYRIEYKAPPKGKTAPTPAPAQTSDEVGKPPVDPNYSSSVYFDPKTKYIWALQLDNQGQLYVATGDRGEIFRVARGGMGALFFKSDEAHIRSLALDKQGNLIAGSDGSGLIYRISPTGEGFVLYSAPKKEITTLAVDASGNIYAAGVGEKRTPPVQAPVIPQSAPQASGSFGGNLVISAVPASQPISIQSFSGNVSAAGSDVYLIAPDGEPRRIWSSKDDIVYAMAFDHNGQLLVGTGNRGRIFTIQPNGEYTDLLKASANQITAFAPAPGGGLYGSTSNLGKVFLLGSSVEGEGTYDSDVFDARIFSRWGRAEVRGRGIFDFFARSGNVDNPDRNWSAWTKVDWANNAPLTVPAARFVQWRAVLRAGNTAPVIDSVTLNYLTKNVSPVIDDVWVQAGARFNPVPKIPEQSQPVQVGGPANMPLRFDAPVPAVRDHDSIAVRWAAHDDNDDSLVYSLYYRGDGETAWKLLRDKITDKFYSWDAGLLPDGGYTIRVVASDLLSHSPSEALIGSRDSSRFEIDRTPPALSDVAARIDPSGRIHLTFRATDGFSPIKRAEYSVDAGDWQYVEPTGEISDAKLESYDVSVPLPEPEATVLARSGDHAGGTGEHVIVVRAYDRFDNMGTAKVVFTVR